MSRRKLTSEQKAARSVARAVARSAERERIEANRRWHEGRAVEARRRFERAVKKRLKQFRKAARRDKSPKVMVLPYRPDPPLQVNPSLGSAVLHGHRVTANYRERRAMGQRGRIRSPRRRELPAALARRGRS